MERWDGKHLRRKFSRTLECWFGGVNHIRHSMNPEAATLPVRRFLDPTLYFLWCMGGKGWIELSLMVLVGKEVGSGPPPLQNNGWKTYQSRTFSAPGIGPKGTGRQRPQKAANPRSHLQTPNSPLPSEFGSLDYVGLKAFGWRQGWTWTAPLPLHSSPPPLPPITLGGLPAGGEKRPVFTNPFPEKNWQFRHHQAWLNSRGTGIIQCECFCGKIISVSFKWVGKKI